MNYLLPILLCSCVLASVARAQEEEVLYFDDLEDDELASDPDPLLASNTTVHAEVGAVALFDTAHEHDLEDVYETRLRASLSLSYRQADWLRFVVGGRVDHFWAAPSRNDDAINGPLSRNDRFELGAELMAAYADVTLAAGVHLRVGQQVFSSGRLDALTALDPLGVYDARLGPSMEPASGRLPQPGASLVYDGAGAFTVELALVPWFRAHRLRLTRDRHASRLTLGDDTVDQLTDAEQDGAPSVEPIATELQLASAAPEPSFSWPQVMARVAYRSRLAELAVSGAYAIEKAPLVYPAGPLEAFLLDPSGDQITDLIALLNATEDEREDALSVRYPRYALLGLDGALFAAPVTIAWEAVVSPERQLYTAPLGEGGVVRPDLSHPGQHPDSGPAGSPLMQFGLHADYLQGETGLLMAEVQYVRAWHLPRDRDRYYVGFHESRADYVIGLVGGSVQLVPDLVRMDLYAVAAYGPTWGVMPRVEVKAAEGVAVAVGGSWLSGPAPPLFDTGGSAALNLGGLLQRNNQAYLSLRWMP